MKHKLFAGAAVAASLALQPIAASAATEIQWWHAFTGRLGDILAKQVETFNASQSDYTVVGSHKGNYSETLNAGIAAFRAGQQPHILMVYEAGTATMMKAKGAIKPAHEVMAEAGEPFDPSSYLAAVTGYYTTTDGIWRICPLITTYRSLPRKTALAVPIPNWSSMVTYKWPILPRWGSGPRKACSATPVDAMRAVPASARVSAQCLPSRRRAMPA